MRNGGARRVLLAALTAVLALGAAEGLCRLAPEPAAPLAGDGIHLLGNPYLLWELRPGDHDELGVRVHVNRDGLRGPELGPKRGPRLLSVGDSSVYGFGVEDGAVWSDVAGRALGVEVLNGAVPGYSSYQAINLLTMRGLATDPDVLVIGTLWSDNNFDSFSDATLLAAHAGWSARVWHWQRLLRESALFRRLDWVIRVRPAGERARKVGWTVGGDDARTGARRVPIEEYARNLDTLARLMADRGKGVVFLLLANRDDVDLRPPEPAWAPYRAVMRDAAARFGAPLVDVPAAFQASGRSADALFLDKMHPSELGHSLVGAAVADALADTGWPRTPLVAAASAARPGRYVDPFVDRAVDPGPRPSGE